MFILSISAGLNQHNFKFTGYSILAIQEDNTLISRKQ